MDICFFNVVIHLLPHASVMEHARRGLFVREHEKYQIPNVKTEIGGMRLAMTCHSTALAVSGSHYGVPEVQRFGSLPQRLLRFVQS